MIAIDMEMPDCCDGCELVVVVPRTMHPDDLVCPYLATRITVNPFAERMPNCPLKEISDDNN